MRGRSQSDPRAARGFSLIEMVVVVVIIGVVGAFGVPRFLKSVEKAKAAEAFGYLSAVREAQERHRVFEGSYAEGVADLDIVYDDPQYFTVGLIRPGSTGSLETSWELDLTRIIYTAGNISHSYTVVFTDQGFDASSTVDAALIPASR